MNNKIAIITTFPIADWDKYAKVMVQSVALYWPEDVDLCIHLDETSQSEEIKNQVLSAIGDVGASRNVTIAVGYTEDHKEFLERNKNHSASLDSKDYRFQYVKFSHKVFAIKKAYDYVMKNGYTHLIWLDADVITHKRIMHDDIAKLLPTAEEGVSYLGRKDWDHSECGFMAFNLSDNKVIDALYTDYVTDNVLTRQQWHDSYVFDQVRKELGVSGKDLTEDVGGRDVFDRSCLAEWMEHLKGPRKFKGIEAKVSKNGAFDFDNVKIQTQNCVDHEIIRNNIKENLSLIEHWIEPLKRNDEEIIIANAGPSLSALDFLDENGKRKNSHKIVAVKHAMDRLLEWGVTPWACILLDPRAHVEEFVRAPHPDVIYFVASMVDPSVVRTLKENNAKVVGYHACVGADEHLVLDGDVKMVAGGSATATRGLSLLEILGFRTFHLFGYDLCSHVEPDLQEKKQNGKLVWEKITLSLKSWGKQEVTRTFWTKGEFLAQAKEFKDLYLRRESIQLHTYGDGMIPWIHKHHVASKNWGKYQYTTAYNGDKEINSFIKGSFNGQQKSSA